MNTVSIIYLLYCMRIVLGKWSGAMLGICLFLCCVECNSSKRDEVEAPSSAFVSESYTQDSAYFVHSINELIRLDDRYFGYYKDNHLEPNIIIDSLLYSPDTMKSIAFVVVKSVETRIKDKPNHEYYIGYVMIGIRDTTCDPWTVYFLHNHPGGVFNSYHEIHNHYRNVMFKYFADFKDDCPTVCPDTVYPRQFEAVRSQSYVYMRYGCNVDDPGFWTEKNLLWRKSVRRRGLYNFQTWHHQATPDQVKEDPHLVYPDSMIAWYRKRCAGK